MALAKRLNELAIANSDGLLNDDEYRLLRQNLFEKYSNNVVIPSEAPLVPIARVHVQLRAGSSNTNPPRSSTPKPVSEPRSHYKSPHPPPNTPLHPKKSVSSSVASLLRRATGRRTLNPSNDLPTTKDKPTAVTPSRLGLQKRPSHLAPLHTDAHPRPTLALHASTSTTSGTSSKRSLPSPSASSSTTRFSSTSPTTTAFTSPSSDKFISSPIRDVFDETHLSSAHDIRTAIALTEDERRKLTVAFTDLEASTRRRIQKQRARRMPMTTPANVNVLLEGREWREHRLVGSPSSPLFDSRERQRYPLGDGVAVLSGSSHRTSLSTSQSISSLPKNPAHPPSSPLSTSTSFHFRVPSMSLSTSRSRLSRKGSMSSMSSQTPSFVSSGMLSAHTTSPTHTKNALTRSASYLGLRKLHAGTSTETVGLGGLARSSSGRSRPGSRSRNGSTLQLHADEDVHTYEVDEGYAGEDAEDAEDDNVAGDVEVLGDIRRRKEDLVARYTARIDFLHAKLRGAEIQEKLLRK